MRPRLLGLVWLVSVMELLPPRDGWRGASGAVRLGRLPVVG
ncbi:MULTISPECIES: hypothetical protein [Micromonospora]|uniref:Uncharacterized protein n=1 Tax=Micromonospora parva TaxID=1464048 RepID=A0ABW6VQQ7_9ACTN|nr:MULTISPECIES: hypothetical protein [Micromonospora]